MLRNLCPTRTKNPEIIILKLDKQLWEKPGLNTEKYGPQSEYRFLRTTHWPIKIQDF